MAKRCTGVPAVWLPQVWREWLIPRVLAISARTRRRSVNQNVESFVVKRIWLPRYKYSGENHEIEAEISELLKRHLAAGEWISRSTILWKTMLESLPHEQ